MDPTGTFYQTLSGVSFTLLGLWFTIMQLGHGGWRTEPARHRAGLHIALHFFLPGVLGMFSLLVSAPSGSLIWRITFALGGLIGLTEAIDYLGSKSRPTELRALGLALLDPVIFVAVAGGSFLSADALIITPLQVEGIVVGIAFVSGLSSAWFALAEPLAGASAEAR